MVLQEHAAARAPETNSGSGSGELRGFKDVVTLKVYKLVQGQFFSSDSTTARRPLCS